jgi:alpha-mannosidase
MLTSTSRRWTLFSWLQPKPNCPSGRNGLKTSHLPLLILAVLGALLPSRAAAQSSSVASPKESGGSGTSANRVDPDLSKQPTLYVVGYAHLDTQWRWEYPQVIQEFIPSTMHDNFTLFEKYPHYIFNFSGSNRYRMMREYHPADYAKVKQYVAQGRWFPAGSSVEESDVNSPAAESILRQVLYGNQFFRREFGKASAEYMLPDCFGFPASLPSLLAHAGIKGFSTQKLTWHSAAAVGGRDSAEHTPPGIPFDVGFWQGPDGKGVIAALNPGSYDGDITEDLSSDPEWRNRVELDGKASGISADYHYYGTGDIGGSPRENSVKLLEAIVTKGEAVLPPPRNPRESERQYEQRVAATTAPEVRVGEGPLRVLSSTAEQMFLDIDPQKVAGLPHYSGELELIEHSAGSLTSEAYHKRWNRKNELLADAAERASVAASWLGARPYPQERLNNAWTLVLGGQFHDIQAGTATPRAYQFSWNDDVLAMNQFADVLTNATQGIVSGLDTQSKGESIVVFNPLNIEREDVVEAWVHLPKGSAHAVRVFGPGGAEVPAQIRKTKEDSAQVLFLARMPAVSFVVYDVQPGAAPSRLSSSELKVTNTSLENARYRVQLDSQGDISSIFDKRLNRELLSAPVRLAFQHEKPSQWPAWNMDWTDQQKPPRAYVTGQPSIRIAENGPVRVALEVARETEGSRFVQTVRLSAGDAGNRVEFVNSIDWKIRETALKATFPLTASNAHATYNWDVGTIQRGNNDPRKYEVASHQWFDLTDKSAAFGVTLLSDCKYGSDKPDDNTLRVTLIYSPGISEHGRDYSDQATQDWGHHEILYGLAGHKGDWREEQTDWQGFRLNQPLLAFQSAKHSGTLGKGFSFLRTSNSRVRVLALKKAEQSDDLIVRLVEMSGHAEPDVHIHFAAPIATAREMNAQEQPLGDASVHNGDLVTTFDPYQLRTFAVKLAAPPEQLPAPESHPVSLAYDRSVATTDGTKSSPGFDASGRSLPSEMLGNQLDFNGVHFSLGPSGTGESNALVAHGQSISLPKGDFNRVYLLAASSDGDQTASFHIGKEAVPLNIQDWGGFVGQWDTRTWSEKQITIPPRAGAPAGTPSRTETVQEYTGLTPGFIKRAPVAWFASHRHTADGKNEPYSYSYLFGYSLEIPPNSTELILPQNDKIRVLAVTVAKEGAKVQPAQPLYDTLDPADR